MILSWNDWLDDMHSHSESGRRIAPCQLMDWDLISLYTFFLLFFLDFLIFSCFILYLPDFEVTGLIGMHCRTAPRGSTCIGSGLGEPSCHWTASFRFTCLVLLPHCLYHHSCSFLCWGFSLFIMDTLYQVINRSSDCPRLRRHESTWVSRPLYCTICTRSQLCFLPFPFIEPKPERAPSLSPSWFILYFIELIILLQSRILRYGYWGFCRPHSVHHSSVTLP